MKPEKTHGLPPEEERRTEVALFRYSLISSLLRRPLERGEIVAHLKAVAARTHRIPYSKRTTVNHETLWRWLAAHRVGGFEALKPQARADQGKPRRVPEEIVAKAIALRQDVPTRSANIIVQILKRDPTFPPGLAISVRTLRGILQQRGVTREKLVGQSKAFRRFERPTPNALWQGDRECTHYARRALPPRCRAPRQVPPHRPLRLHRRPLATRPLWRVLLRGVTAPARAGPQDRPSASRGILKRGALFVDNGKVYVSIQLTAACATLGIRLIHSTPYTPNTRGKIERFFGTVRSQFLSEVEAVKITTLDELNASFQAWIELVYHQAVHSETQETPLDRFQQGLSAITLRQVDPVQLRQALLWREKRTVTRTATLSFQGNRYSVDPLLVGQVVELRFDPFDLSEIDVWQNGHFFAQALVQKLERNRHLSLDRIPPPSEEAKPEHVDFLAALRAEHQTLLTQELGVISFAQVMRRAKHRESTPTSSPTPTPTPTNESTAIPSPVAVSAGGR